jgi:hypothetical protein
MLSDEFLDSLPADPHEAAKVLCDKVLGNPEETLEDAINLYDEYIDLFVALAAYIEAVGLPYIAPSLTGDHKNDLERVFGFASTVQRDLDARKAQLGIFRARERYRTYFGTIFVYEFSEGDLKRIQVLVNELRDFITQSECFDAKHKERVLSRLEALQRELHKKMSSLDKVWALIGEAGVAMGKFGQDAKPLVDRVREVLQIIWRTQARAEELPSATPLPLLTSDKPRDA